MNRLKTAIFLILAATLIPAILMAQETQSFENCVGYVATQNPIKGAIGVGFLVVLVIFGFLKKSFPSAIKDIAIKVLGGSSSKP